MTARRVAAQGLLTGLALLLGYVERLLPPLVVALPGVKLGLANLSTLVALLLLGPGSALCVALARILLASFLFAGVASLPYALAGGMLAWLAMALAMGTRRLGPPGISLCGGVLHNVGQLGVAAFFFQNAAFWAYLPALTLAGSVTGFALGILAGLLEGRLRKALPALFT